MPIWEREAWKSVFELFGPLDWKRADFLFARVNQYQAVGGAPLKDFILFHDPTETETETDKEDDLLKKLGWSENE